MNTTFARIIAIASICWAAGAAHADFSGRVIGIVDGDTIDVLVEQKPVRIRLAEVDAPERRQPFGSRSRETLSTFVFGQVVTIRDAGKDRYGRVIGTVMSDGASVNRAMVAAGMAWAYRKYLVDRILLDVEAQARAQKRGLWADADPVAPWEWRAEKSARAERATPP
jgi:micrococcal nuclease